VLAHLESLGYKGYVGCEYIPHSDTWSGLQWATGYLGDARVEKN
jgi:hydroxypyruvate isomerase